MEFARDFLPYTTKPGDWSVTWGELVEVNYGYEAGWSGCHRSTKVFYLVVGMWLCGNVRGEGGSEHIGPGLSLPEALSTGSITGLTKTPDMIGAHPMTFPVERCGTGQLICHWSS